MEVATDGVLVPGSIGDKLRAAREKHSGSREKTFEVQGFDGQLFATYRALGYKEARRIGGLHTGVKEIAERELRVAADTLAAACTGTEAVIDGERHKLPPMGMALNTALGLEPGENPKQAVMALFPADVALMAHFEGVGAFIEDVEAEADEAVEDQLGNSEAAR